MSGQTNGTQSTKIVTNRGLAIGGSTIIVAPLVPFFWNRAFPEWPMNPEVAAAAAGLVTVFLGFIYAVVLKVLQKYDIAP